MEENKVVDMEFYKVRSYSSCLMNGFKLFADNLWTIFKHTWLPIMFFAVLVSLCSFMYQPLARLVFTSADPSRLPYFPQILFSYLLLFLLSVSVLASSFFGGTLTVMARNYIQTGHLHSTGKENLLKKALQPSLRWFVFSFVFLLLNALLSGSFHYFVGTAWWTWFWDFLLILAVYIPYSAFMVMHTLDPSAYVLRLSTIKMLYRNWGSWSAVYFVSGLFLVVCSILFSLPAFVLLYARSEAFFMELGGDITDLPIAFSLMQILVVMLSAGLSLFFFSAYYFSMLFMHGSLTQKQAEITHYEEKQQQMLQD